MENFNYDKLISIIVPMYNVELYLEKCVESIEKQTYQNIEVILVDDGSKDNTLEIANNLAKKYDNINVYMQKNQGQGAARNTGIAHLHGEYVMFIDADDFMSTEMCEKLLTIMLRFRLDIVECSYQEVFCLINTMGYVYHTHVPEKVILTGSDFYENKPILSCCNKLYSKEYLNKINFKFTENHFAEDVYDISSVILHAKRIMRIDKSLYYYRKDNVSSTRNSQNLDHKIKLGTDKLFIAEKLNRLRKELGTSGYMSNIIVRNIFGAVFSPNIFKLPQYRKKISSSFNEYGIINVLYENISLKILYQLFIVGFNRIFFHKD
jgi:glycosyltransferase involved in cell wall biosynthesis